MFQSLLLLICSLATTAAAVSNIPSRLRLSLDGDDTSNVILTWTTPYAPSSPVVRYGEISKIQDKQLWNIKVAHLRSSCIPIEAPKTYDYPLKNYTSQYIGSCKLTNLKAGVTYSYTVEANPNDVTVATQFIAPTSPTSSPSSSSSSASSLRIAFIGDMGQTINSTHTRDHIIVSKPFAYNHVVIVGDMSYADSQKTRAQCNHPGGCSPTRWDSWEDFYEPLGSIVPTMVLTGNHEIELTDAPLNSNDDAMPGMEPFLNYKNRFPMPHVEDKQYFYSYDVGTKGTTGIHFIHLSSYDIFVDPLWNSTEGKQYIFLKADLEKVDRSITPWVIMCTHSPWYNSNKAHHDEYEEVQLRTLMEDLLYTYNVDMMFSGHVHAYERSHPVYQEKITKGATTYINIGDGGNREGPADSYYAAPKWSAFREGVFGHGELEIFNSTMAEWKWKRNNIQEVKKEADSVRFVKRNGINGGVVALSL